MAHRGIALLCCCAISVIGVMMLDISRVRSRSARSEGRADREVIDPPSPKRTTPRGGVVCRPPRWDAEGRGAPVATASALGEVMGHKPMRLDGGQTASIHRDPPAARGNPSEEAARRRTKEAMDEAVVGRMARALLAAARSRDNAARHNIGEGLRGYGRAGRKALEDLRAEPGLSEADKAVISSALPNF